ncbi:LCP family protein [Stomatohabitans albus]|uniref:LCP family protein n=1 Tax=Stomatohabitans albus TaxID=3110766 RepID=UPI00300CDB50
MSKPKPYLQPGRFGPREQFGRPRNGGPDWKRLLIGAIGTGAVAILGVTGVYGVLLVKEINSINNIKISPTAIAFTPAPEVTETVTLEPVDPVKDRTTILMVGSDSRKGLSKEQLAAIGTADDGSDLTDTIILAQLNPENDQVAMLSMPRDLVVRRCDGTKGRINEAWYVGELQGKDQGAACLIQTIEQHTGIGIDHVMRVNFSGFVNVVDTLGGVDFAVDRDMKDRWSGLDIKKGCNHFDGVKAIQFVRARHIDSDFGRQARQQRFAREMIKKATSLGTLTNPVKVAGLIDSASDAIETDTGLDVSKLADLAWSMRSVTPDKLVAVSVPASNGRLGEAAVLYEDKKDAEKIYAAFRNGQAVDASLLMPNAEDTAEPTASEAGTDPIADASATPSSAPSSPASASSLPTPAQQVNASSIPMPSASSSTPTSLPSTVSEGPTASSVPGVPGLPASKETYAGAFDPGISCP